MSCFADGAIKEKRFLVTGGAGFIGSHLVSRLLDLGAAHITVVDSLRYGDIEHLSGHGDRVRVIRHTLGTDPVSRIEEAMRGIDGVFHLAAEKHNQSKDSPYQVVRANVDGTYTICEAAAAAGVKRLVYTSSLYAYGRMHLPPFEEAECPAPRTVYGTTKLAGEHLCRFAGERWGLEYNVLRYLFIYGPKQFAGMGYKSVIVSNFERILRGEAPVIYGDGLQSLDYVFVDDAVDATVRAMTCAAASEVLNVASGHGVRVRELVETMRSVSGSKLEPVYGPADWTAGTERVGSGENAARVLGWRPQITLEGGLRRTFEWMKSRTEMRHAAP